MVALALIASYARNQGLIDAETTTRIVIVAVGLMVVWMGNRIPKTFAPSAGARRAQRVAAWSLVIGGLIYTAAFAFAPMDVAMILGCGAVGAAFVITFAYCLMLRSRARAA
ncbi:MAG: SdpI family protein [Brevundimonas sp.]|nr:MAG: SdpI family protein [Brevundimonas sp.]